MNAAVTAGVWTCPICREPSRGDTSRARRVATREHAARHDIDRAQLIAAPPPARQSTGRTVRAPRDLLIPAAPSIRRRIR